MPGARFASGVKRTFLDPPVAAVEYGAGEFAALHTTADHDSSASADPFARISCKIKPRVHEMLEAHSAPASLPRGPRSQ